MFTVKRMEELELLYSVLREQHPDRQISVSFNWNTKEYTVVVTDKPFTCDPNVPLDLNIEVVYGDSVTGDTPLLLRDPTTKQVTIRTIDNLISEWQEYPQFKVLDTTIRLEKQCGTTHYEVWCDQGWNPIKKVIRHKTNKKIYRVVTHNGVVDVTEDHSLCTPTLKRVKPKDLVVGQELLHSFPSEFPTSQPSDTADGPSFLESVSGTVSAGTLQTALLSATAITAGSAQVSVKEKVDAQRLYYFMKSLKLNPCVVISDNTEYEITNDKIGKGESSPTAIKQIIEMPFHENSFVYDLETECGRYNAGIGEITCYNTDSIFVRFRYNRDDFESNRRDTFRLATLCGDKLTDEIFARPPIEMEFEKVFQPFILLTKKRYIAHKYDNVKDPFQLKGLDAKGIALTRRDYCKMVKSCYKEIIDTIMDTKGNNLKRSIAVFKAYVDRIDNYDIDIENLVVSAMLAKSYKTKPVHVVLAEKLRERKEEVQVGDRIPYIYIETDDPKRQKSELGEDPQYAIRNGLQFNRKCYLEQLAKPILGFYKIVLQDDEALLDDVIQYVNDHLVEYGGKRLKPSDFKIEE
jgi:hypothetical protein